MVCQKTSEQWFDEKGWYFNENNDFVDKHVRIKNLIYKELKQRFGFMQYPVPARPVKSRRDLTGCDEREFMKRVKAIALVDGDSGTGLHHMEGGRWLKEHSWSFSQRRLGMKPPPNGEFVATNDHDTVPGMAVNEIFEFLQESLHWYEAKLPQDEYDKGKDYYGTITATTATTATTTTN
ncbi:hypothetical protein BG011_000855 [Mortierella polycephala]|uniref:Uncharacterized protein n=1 Tax=Mortierella polycephala TaxID=41804 RepID=A0A9P6QFL8_9FUNG|nr:hypothetical protein BG011_000855 [Mortierella polycephala]